MLGCEVSEKGGVFLLLNTLVQLLSFRQVAQRLLDDKLVSDFMDLCLVVLEKASTKKHKSALVKVPEVSQMACAVGQRLQYLVSQLKSIPSGVDSNSHKPKTHKKSMLQT